MHAGAYGLNFDRRNQSYLQPRLDRFDNSKQEQEQSEIQKMLDRKKGFDIIDSEELYHLMHNQYYAEWKEKRDQMVLKAAQSRQKSKRKHNGSRYVS